MNTIKLTEKAVSQIKQVLAEQNMQVDKTYVRAGLQGMSCSGPAYAFGLDDKYDADLDDISIQQGLSVVNRKEFANYLSQVTVDYKDDADKKGFTFKNTNPLQVLNNEGGCGSGGCGSGGCCGGGCCGGGCGS